MLRQVAWGTTLAIAGARRQLWQRCVNCRARSHALRQCHAPWTMPMLKDLHLLTNYITNKLWLLAACGKQTVTSQAQIQRYWDTDTNRPKDAKDAGTSNPRTAASFLFVNYTLVCVIFTGSDRRASKRLLHRKPDPGSVQVQTQAQAQAPTQTQDRRLWQVIQKYFERRGSQAAGTKWLHTKLDK